LNEVAEIEDHVQNDIHPHQHHETDAVVLDEIPEHISVENFHDGSDISP
jgi:hypothetical protein